MLASLERLETKFGRLPSILSTRADYVDDLAIKEALFIEAYEGAARSGDELNQLLTAHSLAELYIDDHRNASKGRVWLTTLRVHIAELDEPDAQFDKDYSRMALEPSNPDQGTSSPTALMSASALLWVTGPGFIR